MNVKRMLTITKKEFIHIKRDRPSLMISFIMPIIMLLLFGFAVTTDVNHIKMAVYDGTKTVESRALIERFSHAYYFDTYASVNSPKAAETLIEQGRVKVALIIPPDYTKKVHRQESAEIQILVDGSDPTIARTAGSYAGLVTNEYANELKIKQLQSKGNTGAVSPTIIARPLMLYNPTLESSKFNVPGVIGLILQNLTIILTALAMVREKELGTIEQLVMTPVTGLELILGKLIPYVLIGCYDFAIIMILSYVVFGVTVSGSMFQLIVLGLVFLIGALAMGMLISTFAENQAQAIQAAMVFLLPSVILSGFMFPREAMSPFIYWLGSLFPITHFLVILRGIIVKGVGIGYMLNTAAALFAILFAIIFITVRKFSKTLD